MSKLSFIRIVKVVLLPACMVTACTDAEFLSPSTKIAALSPRFASASGDTEITIWHEGQSYTFNAENRQLRSGDGRSLYVDDQLTADLRTAFQSILEGDVLSQALRSAAGDGPGEIMEPYRLGGRPAHQQGRRVEIFESGEFSSGPKVVVRLIPVGGLGGGDDLGGVSLASTDNCADIAGLLLGTRTSFREKRHAFLGKIGQALVDGAAGLTLSAGEGIGHAISLSGAEAAYAHINMAIYGSVWNLSQCSTKKITATGFVMVSGFGGSAATDADGITSLYCYRRPEWVEINGSLYNVDLKVCSFRPQWQ